jgi:hypothetical protein
MRQILLEVDGHTCAVKNFYINSNAVKVVEIMYKALV